MKNILLIEDDTGIAQYICSNLEKSNYHITHVAEASNGLKTALSQPWSCILLDRMLPVEVDGLDILKALRALGNSTPVIIVSALEKIDERILCLKAGADDYLPKPFFINELEARLEAVMRRSNLSQAPLSHAMQIGNLHVDLITHTVYRDKEKILLNPREFKLLAYLIKNAGQTVTRAMVLENVWDYDFQPETNIIDVHISHLRQKIDEKGAPSLIRTIRGVGYSIDAPAP
ncbi:response regulator transcription factor [Comamonas jiangduensis]|uniref:response regulator transcription factor n=1 Tax=Comamonas jiangduensis TaxID=1194168 RepID=UPI0028AE0255|nr:response regulator transcription factor [Comamonas jiangduensis]MBS7349391.1 response regulator transcription factor [Comamonas sp.]